VAVDRVGRTIAPGDVYLLAGVVARILADRILVRNAAGQLVHVRASDIVTVDQAALAVGSHGATHGLLGTDAIPVDGLDQSQIANLDTDLGTLASGVAAAFSALSAHTGDAAAHSPAFGGDVDKAAGGTTTTIGAKKVLSAHLNDNVVDLTKLLQVATGVMLGRLTAATGNLELLTAAQVRTLLVLGTAALLNEGMGGTDLVNVTNFTNYLAAVLLGYEVLAAKGAANGYSPLNASAIVPPANLPAALTFVADFLQATTAAGAPGYVPCVHYIRANTTRTLPNDTNENAVFNSPANGRVTLAAGVYRFTGLLYVTAMHATSGNASIDILGAGTAVCTQWLWHNSGIDATDPTIAAAHTGTFPITQQSAASVVLAATGTAMGVKIYGTVKVSVAGTLIPSIDQVTAAAAVVAVGSHICFERIGGTSAVSLGPWD